MKSHSRTSLLLTAALVVPLLGLAIASRLRESPATIQANSLPADDSADLKRLPAISTPPAPITFELFKIQTTKSIAELQSRLGTDAFEAILKINRLDRRHLRAGDVLVIPTPGADPMSASPFPVQLEVARNIPKLILVSRRVQAFGAYESGKLVRWGPTSTGKKSTPTPAKLYHTNWKAKKTRSSVNASWILPWYFNLDSDEGIAFHQYDLPGYPASHGCVRLLEEDAKWIYEWADQWMRSKNDQSVLALGTPVLIYGNYTYSDKPLRMRLASDPGAGLIAISEIETELNQHTATIATRVRARQQLISSQLYAAITSDPFLN